MEPQVQVKEYGIYDLHLAAYLIGCGGMRFLRLERRTDGSGKQHRFVLEDRADREELVRSYVNKGTVADFRAYRHALDDLKALIHNWQQ